MRMLLLLALLSAAFATTFGTAFAQTGSRPQAPDSAVTPLAPAPDTALTVPHSLLQLPPSILSELRRSETGRAVLFRDTIKASDRMRQYLNDTVEHHLDDSAFTFVDTAVSLSHHDWLDSELVEIPEIVRFGNHIHFNYPPAIMVETDPHAVPFDSSLLGGMNPISRVNLPFFDQSPIPLPLPAGNPFEAFLEAGGGNLYQPTVKGWLTYTFSPRTSLDATVDVRSLAKQMPLHSYTHIGGSFNAQLGEDPGASVFKSSGLTVSLDYTGKNLAIRQDSTVGTTTTDHTLSQFTALASLSGDGSDRFHYELSGADREFKDDLGSSLTESTQSLHAGFHFDPYISHFRLIGEGSFEHASLSSLTPSSRTLTTISDPMSAYAIKGLFGRRKGEAIEWYFGAELLGGFRLTSASNANYTSVSPVARVRFPLNSRWELGASYEPQVQLASDAVLAQINPYYSPHAASLVTPFDSTAFDSRSVVIDKVNLSAFMNYMLSLDDEVRIEARFITRQNEPVFEQHSLHDSSAVFTVTPKDTRRFELSFNSNFLFFTRDILSAAVDLRSATIAGEDRELPFEESMSFNVSYHFNSISDVLHPAIEFRSIARKDRDLSFLNAELRVDITRQISAFVRGENILGGPDDFWTGYSEYPRSIWASVRYSF